MSELPKVPSKWVHYKGNEYEVYDLLNTDADPGREVDHPVIVCYRGANGRKWGKTLEVFLNTMKPKGFSLQAPAFIAQVEPEPLPFRPKIDLWDPETKSLASFYVASNASDEDKLAFVYALWDERFNYGKCSLGDATMLARRHPHLELTHITASMRDSLTHAHVSHASNTQGMLYATPFVSSQGVDLLAFAAIVHSICVTWCSLHGTLHSVPVVQGLCKFSDQFNTHIRKYMVSRLFWGSDYPQASVESNNLYITLPQNVAQRSRENPHKLQLDLSGPNLGLLWHPETLHLAELFELFEDSWNAHTART